jgi:hypothetical protein
MNSSLSPNEQLGRMLHNFNSTAYEVDEYKFENLIKNNLITPIDHTKKTIRWETVKLSDADIFTNTNLLKYKAVGLRFEGMIPGDKVFINDGIYRFTGEYDQWTNDPKMEQGYTVVIGGTGSYNLDISDNIEITEVYFKSSVDNLEVDEKWV